MNETTTIEINGKTYVLDITKAIKLGILTEKKKYPSCIGQRIRTLVSDKQYIIASVDADNGVNLIGLDNGCRINAIAVTVKHIYNITEQEIDRLCKQLEGWSLVTDNQ